MQRHFQNEAEHACHLVDQHNLVVAKEDLVYVVGDALVKFADPERWLQWLETMNGRKILIRGNHDTPFSDEMFAPYFEHIVPEGDGIELDVEGIPCWLTHYPTRGRHDRFNLVGHVHGAWKVQLNALNVSVDCHHYRPVPLDAIPFFYEAIGKHYDDDIFAAYDASNMAHLRRGVKGSYYKS